MKLNFSLCKRILMELENDLKFPERISFNMFYSNFSNTSYFKGCIPAFTQNDVFYSICKLSDAGFIKLDAGGMDNTYITDLTWDGHIFIYENEDKNSW